MAEATITAGANIAAGRTRAAMREVLDRELTGTNWWDRISRAPKGAWAYVEQAARYALASRAAGFIKARISWGRQLLADLGIINIAGYAATTIEGRAAIRGILTFGWKVLSFPFKVIGKPIGWVLAHTGRPGRWVHDNAFIMFCWTRDHLVAGYNTTEAWLEAHDDDAWVRWARAFFHWRIVSRLVDRFAPRWMPRWLRYVIKLGFPGLSFRSKRGTDGTEQGSVFATAAAAAADGLDTLGDALDNAGETVADVTEHVKAAARSTDGDMKVRTVPLREGKTGKTVEAEILDFGTEVFVRVKGTADFVRGTVPAGYEEIALTEVTGDAVVTEGDVPVPGSREARREAGREARREAAKVHGPSPRPKPGPPPVK